MSLGDEHIASRLLTTEDGSAVPEQASALPRSWDNEPGHDDVDGWRPKTVKHSLTATISAVTAEGRGREGQELLRMIVADSRGLMNI
jgi:hypothetical protein